ncbi:MAG: hydantoinase B/oxoprolinase family protein [Thermoplasmatota archaeon]
MSKDPVTTRIVKNALDYISDEMFWTAIRTAKSSILYETYDFAPALTDKDGDLISIGLGVPAFLGVMPYVAKNMMTDIEEFDLELDPGDIFVCNDPYKVATHMNDIALMMPIFYEGEIVSIATIKAHVNDVGGMNPGSWGPDATEIYQEGIRVPTSHFYKGDKLNKEIANLIKHNSRVPDYVYGDLEALAAALRYANKRINELCDKYGAETIKDAMKERKKDGKIMAKDRMKDLPKGKYHSEVNILKYKGMDEDITLKADIEITDGKFIVDLSDNPDQVKAPINTSYPGTYAAIATIFTAATDPHVNLNQGYLEPLEIIVPEGSILNATSPAPVGCYWETMIYAFDMIWKALASELPDKLTAGHFVSVVAENIGMMDPRDDKYKILVEPNPGGWGAGIDKDGESSLVSAGDGETYAHPVEVLEREYPIRVESMRLNKEDGVGHGKFRGGFGMWKDYRILAEEGSFTTSINRIKYPPWGIEGGEYGSCNHMVIVRDGEEIWDGGRKLNFPLRKGDIVSIRSGGGGGWGDPLERDPKRVLNDYKNGLVDSNTAEEKYGVILNEEELSIDFDATEKLRKKMKKERGPAKTVPKVKDMS